MPHYHERRGRYVLMSSQAPGTYGVISRQPIRCRHVAVVKCHFGNAYPKAITLRDKKVKEILWDSGSVREAKKWGQLEPAIARGAKIMRDAWFNDA